MAEPRFCKGCKTSHDLLLPCGVAKRRREAEALPAVAVQVEVKPTVKPESASPVKPVKPPTAEPARSNAKSWRERDPEAYRAYMRGYMAKRRAAGKVT